MSKQPPEIDVSEYNAEINGNMTFHYAVKTLYDKGLSSRWRAVSTRIQYNNEFNNILFKNVTDELPLKDLSKEYFDSVIDTISDKYYRDNKKHLSESRIAHYKYLIRKLVATAADNGICDDYLWGTTYTTDEEDISGDEKRNSVLKTTQKSLTPKQELKIYNRIMIFPDQSGQKIGLAIMFCCGLRNEEACGLNYEDLIEIPKRKGHFCLRVYRTTYQYSNDLKSRGKTSNAYRVIPIPKALADLLLARKEYLQSLFESGIIKTPVEKLPIVCNKNKYEERCISNHLTDAGRQLFKDIKADERLLQAAEEELIESSKSGIDIEDEVVQRKEATTYLLRRNFATHILILGLDDVEIQYVMGHKIEDPSFNRNDLNNPDKLYAISKKLNERALVGAHDYEDSSLTKLTDEPLIINSQNSFDFEFSGEAYIQLNTDEPSDDLRIRFHNPTGSELKGTCFVIPLDEDYSKNVNVLTEYHNAYKKYESSKEPLQPVVFDKEGEIQT
ncbi:MAG: tyrosine-type recombinase/integrase [Ruminococcus sp.]